MDYFDEMEQKIEINYNEYMFDKARDFEKFEDSLKEVDKVCEDELKKEFKDEENDVDSIQEVESALKKTIENRLANIGIHAKLSRNHRVKKTVKSNKGAAKRTAGKR